jgi:asparagine synthase (glutamine-hydrolysing)
MTATARPSITSRARRRARRVSVDRWLRRRPELVQLVGQVRAERLTYLSRGALADLAWAARRLTERGIDGEVVEAGTALGGSALVLGLAKDLDRPMRVFDTFAMIPEPGELDGDDVLGRWEEIRAGSSSGIDGDDYYGYQPDLLERVRLGFAEHGIDMASRRITLVPGLFEDTLVLDGPVALAHIDADWYDSVATCLERIHPVLVEGGRLVIDDYGSWSGARRAVDDFLDGPAGRQYAVEARSRFHLVRRSSSRRV